MQSPSVPVDDRGVFLLTVFRSLACYRPEAFRDRRGRDVKVLSAAFSQHRVSTRHQAIACTDQWVLHQGPVELPLPGLLLHSPLTTR